MHKVAAFFVRSILREPGVKLFGLEHRISLMMNEIGNRVYKGISCDALSDILRLLLS
jgi:hypothetical protein